jgi:hypothetical protein
VVSETGGSPRATRTQFRGIPAFFTDIQIIGSLLTQVKPPGQFLFLFLEYFDAEKLYH